MIYYLNSVVVVNDHRIDKRVQVPASILWWKKKWNHQKLLKHTYFTVRMHSKDLFRMVSYYYIVLYIEYDKKSRKVIFNLSILFSKEGNRRYAMINVLVK